MTTGSPIALVIENVDQRAKDYSDIKRQVSSGSCRLHLRRQVRHPRLSRRRPAVGARDRQRGSRPAPSRARSLPGMPVRGRARFRWASTRIDRARWELGRGRAQSRSSARMRRRPGSSRAISTTSASRGSSVGAVIEVVAGGRSGRSRRSGLRQARRRSRRGPDGHQCRQGRRDRGGLRRRRR